MGSRRTTELARLLRRLPLALLAAVAVWVVLKPVYNELLCSATQAVARTFEPPPRAALIVRDGDGALLGRTDLRSDSGYLRISLAQIHFNLVPFLALTLALPGALRGRGWRRALAALAVLGLSHLLALLWQLKYLYAFQLGPWSTANYSDLARNVYGFLRYSFDLPVAFTLPLLLWLVAFRERLKPLVGLETERG
ncbi:MAG: hypothetical protein ACM3O7_08300 [Acidobacteriota bacterium]